jgi:hypothetical protein
MADSKNPPVLPEGYDPELEKANKGMAKYEAEQAAAQAKLAARDEKAKNKAKALMDFGLGILRDVKEPVKKAKGGSVKSASARADGCAVRGKTRA